MLSLIKIKICFLFTWNNLELNAADVCCSSNNCRWRLSIVVLSCLQVLQDIWYVSNAGLSMSIDTATASPINDLDEG